MSSSWTSSSKIKFEFKFKFQVRLSGLNFQVRVSGSLLGNRFRSLLGTISGAPFGPFSDPFRDPFSVPFRVHFGTHFRSLLGSRKGPEKEHSEQLVNSQHSKRISSRKCRVGGELTHSRISLTLPLSSFGWLRNNSSSHRCSVGFSNFSKMITKRTPQLLGTVTLCPSSRAPYP